MSIERQDSIKNTRLLAAEAHLASSGNEIRERFYMLISKMEEEVNNSLKINAMAADKLAVQTYRWLAGFTILGSLLVIMVLIIVARYVHKTSGLSEGPHQIEGRNRKAGANAGTVYGQYEP